MHTRTLPAGIRHAIRTAATLAALIPGLLLAQTYLEREAVVLDRFDVTDSRVDSYTTATASATKLALPLLETPQNIQVVPDALLADQGALTLEAALRNVAGVAPGGYYANWDYYRIRGFNSAFNAFVDGLRGGNGMSDELFGISQVEVIKGPASSLFGQAPLGGVVNLVSKRPATGTSTNLDVAAGSFGYRSASVDLNMPLTASGSLLFRLPAIVHRQDSFVDEADSRRTYFAPAVTARIGDDTSVTLLAKYSDLSITHAMPLPAKGTVLPNVNGPIPHKRFLGEPGTSKGSEIAEQGGYEFAHRFGPSVTLRQNFRYDRYEQVWDMMLYPSHLSTDECLVYRYPYNYWQTWHDLAVDTRVEVTADTGVLRHQVLAGFDFYRKDLHAISQTIDFGDPAAYVPLDLFSPVYGITLPPLQPKSGFTERTKTGGFYVQDHVQLPGYVTLTAGARYDRAEKDAADTEAVSPRVGVTWELRPGASVYANYDRSFQPQFGFANAAGAPLDPETGTNWEVGAKTAAPDGRLTATIAVYELTRANVAAADPSKPFAYLLTGEQRSRGFEFDGRFTPAPGWEVTAAYAFTDVRITKDTTLPVGARAASVPCHAVSVWAKHSLHQGRLKGFGYALGVRYYSNQEGDATYASPFRLPAYSLVDAALYYSRGRFRAQVNVSNALDREYYPGAYSALYVMPGEPRIVRVSAGWRF